MVVPVSFDPMDNFPEPLAGRSILMAAVGSSSMRNGKDDQSKVEGQVDGVDHRIRIESSDYTGLG